jgi:hypothetical protein
MWHRLRLRVLTGSDWLHENTLQYLDIERFSPISVPLQTGRQSRRNDFAVAKTNRGRCAQFIVLCENNRDRFVIVAA